MTSTKWFSSPLGVSTFPGFKFGTKVALVFLLLVTCLPGAGLTQHSDMSGEWIVRMANADSCSALFQFDSSTIVLSKEAEAFISNNEKFEGQSQYYLGESAYKCSFVPGGNRLAYINLALQLFESSLEMQGNLGEDGPLDDQQQVKLYFRRAFAKFRKIELEKCPDLDSSRIALQGIQTDLRYGKVVEHEGAIGIAGSYLLGTTSSLLNKLSFYDAVASGDAATEAALPAIIAECKSIYGMFSDLSGRPLPDNDLVDIDKEQFYDAVRLNRIGELVFLAKLQLMHEESADDSFKLIETNLGATALDDIYRFQIARLKWVQAGAGKGVKNLKNILAQVPTDENGYASLLGVLFSIESKNYNSLFIGGLGRERGDSRVYYWLAKAQVFLGEDRVTAMGARYQPEVLLGSFLSANRVLGDDYLRQDALILKQEIAFEKVLSQGTIPNLRKLELIYDELKEWYPDNLEIEGRKKLLLELLAGNGVEVLSVTWDNNMDEKRIIAYLKASFTAPSVKLSRVFLEKTMALLDEIDPEDEFDNFGKDKKYFYTAVLEKAWAKMTSSHGQSIKHLNKSIIQADLISPASAYSSEGKYLAALSAKELYYYDRRKDVYDAGIDRLVKVVQEDKNVRALYYLAGELKDGPHNMQAAKYSHMVKTVITNTLKNGATKNQFYQWCDDIFPGYQPQSSIKVGPNNGVEITASQLKWPVITLPNGMYLEEFANKKFLQANKIKEFMAAIDLLSPLPPVPYYSNNLFEGTWLHSYAYPGITSGINEGAKKEMTGMKVTVLAPSPAFHFDGAMLEKTQGGDYFEMRDLEQGSLHEIMVTSVGFFDYLGTRVFKGFPVDEDFLYLYLAEETTYSNSADKISEESVAVISQGNKVFVGSEGSESQFLTNKLGYEVRDFVKSKSGHFYYCVNAKSNTIDRVPANGAGMVQTFLTGAEEEFTSPEGIAIDRDGNIYVTDFGKNEVVVFNSDGKVLMHFGKERDQNALTFPTRIALEEDLIGFKHGTKSYYRPSFLYVADWNGIHRFDLLGNKIDTVVAAKDGAIEVGEFYGIGVVGYGSDAKLIVLKRDDRKALKYEAKLTH